MLEGKHQHSTIDQMVIDYLRSTYGGTGLRSNLAKHSLERAHSVEPEDMERMLELSVQEKAPHRLDFDECARWIEDPIDRCTFGLFFYWGLSVEEIGNLFGVGKGRISQRIKGIQRCILERLKGT